jgi:hypothetical protein
MNEVLFCLFLHNNHFSSGQAPPEKHLLTLGAGRRIFFFWPVYTLLLRTIMLTLRLSLDDFALAQGSKTRESVRSTEHILGISHGADVNPLISSSLRL